MQFHFPSVEEETDIGDNLAGNRGRRPRSPYHTMFLTLPPYPVCCVVKISIVCIMRLVDASYSACDSGNCDVRLFMK
jgi:hypothetical protein